MEDQGEGSFKTPTLPPVFLKPGLKEKQKLEKKPEQKAETLSENKSSNAPIVNNVATPPPLEYTPPSWACEPTPGICYRMEILKSGTVIDVQDLEKRNHNPTFVVIGRLPNCDIQMEHPSVSRYHCILQYGDDRMGNKEKGWFIYDMGSTHGTKMNKNRIPPKQFIRIQVGFVFQFGNSTRICNLLGPAEDAEPEWDCSPTEMREKMKKKALEAKLAAAARKEFEEEKEQEEKEDEGINWGMDYGDEGGGSMFDFDGEVDGEAYYLDDPKKALAKFFERVGFEMNFVYSESGMAHTHKWTCSIELPVEVDGVDRACTAQATVSTSKKDATIQCALEACKILDRYGALRGGSSRLKMKKKTLEDNDFYDEDDDLYFDRTGQLETQRDKRKVWTLKAMGKMKEEKDTYETLNTKLKATREQMAEIQKELDELGHNKVAGQAADVDDYVNQLAKGKITVKDDMQTKIHKSTLRQKLVSLTHEAQTLEKLVKITKPTALPDLAPGPSSADANKQAFLRKMMKFGNVKKQLADVEAKAVTEHTANTEVISNKPSGENTESKGQNVEVIVKETEVLISKPSEDMDKKDIITQPPEKRVEIPETSTKNRSPAKQLDLQTDSKESPSVVPEQPVLEAKHETEPSTEDRKRLLTANDEPGHTHKKRKPHIRKEKWEEYGTGCEFKDEQYATWMPPENQSGDGTTSLNAKFAGRY